MTFERDLELWDHGQLERAELAARHPGEDVGSVLSLFEQLTAAGSVEVGPEEDHWAALRARLPERSTAAPVRRPVDRGARVGRLLRRPLIAAVAVVALSGAAAFAASPSVRTQVGHVVHRVTHLLAPERHQPPAPGPAIASPPAEPTAVQSPHPSPTGHQSEGGDHSGGGSTSGDGSDGSGGGSSEGSGSGGSGGSDGSGSSGSDGSGSGGSDHGGSGGGSGDGTAGSGSGDQGSGSGDSQSGG